MPSAVLFLFVIQGKKLHNIFFNISTFFHHDNTRKSFFLQNYRSAIPVDNKIRGIKHTISLTLMTDISYHGCRNWLINQAAIGIMHINDKT